MVEDKILNGKLLAEKLNSEIKKEVEELKEKTGINPKIVTILVGENPSSEIYIKIKHRKSSEVGIESEAIKLPNGISKEELINHLGQLNRNKSVHGILLQLPLPQSLKPYTNEILQSISPEKDIDGLHPINKGYLFDYKEDLVACTPQGIIALLEYYHINLEGKHVVIVNRSNLVGKPLIFMLLKRNATVTICHSFTKNVFEHTKRADILIVAVGQANFIDKEKIKQGVIIIDVGTNRIEGKLCGDVNFNDVIDICGAITPSPGGVGPLTVSFLLRNTIKAYKKILKSSNFI